MTINNQLYRPFGKSFSGNLVKLASLHGTPSPKDTTLARRRTLHRASEVRCLSPLKRMCMPLENTCMPQESSFVPQGSAFEPRESSFFSCREVPLSHRKAQLWHGLSTALATAGQSVSIFKPLFSPSDRFGKKR